MIPKPKKPHLSKIVEVIVEDQAVQYSYVHAYAKRFIRVLPNVTANEPEC